MNYNTNETTLKVIEHFRAAEPNLDCHFILIDNGSEPALEWNSSDSSVRFIRNDENKGFAPAVNQGLALAQSDYILLLNSDVFIEAGTISSLIEAATNDIHVGIIGPKLVFPDKRFQPSCGSFPTAWREFFRFSYLGRFFPLETVANKTIFNTGFFTKARTVDWISGACFLIKKELIEKIGVLDDHYFLGVEDIDFCLRAKRAGYKTIYFPLVSAIHYHNLSYKVE